MATKKRIALGTTSRRPVSPLHGLAKAVEKMSPGERKELFRQPTPEEKKRRDSVRRIKALVAFVKEAPGWNGGLRMYESHRDKDFSWLDFGEREPHESFMVADDGRITRHTCQYSGHNGDSYGDEYFDLKGEAAQKALDALVSRLEGLALAAEERRLEEAARRRKAKAAKKNLDARLRAKGLL